MPMFNNCEIVQMPLSLRRNRQQVEEFLATNGLRLDEMDYYAAVVDRDNGKMLAGGGFKDDIIKCIAVSDSLRGTGMSQQLISYLISEMNSRGYNSIKVFTKPDNAEIFSSMGFKTIGESKKALFLENGLEGISNYVKYLSSLKKQGKNGVIVMNANPFTLGHLYLVERAANMVDNLYVIAVEEDKSQFTSDERLAMIQSGCAHLSNVTVCHGSSYSISAATFPSYFIKKLDDVAETQIELDLDVMVRHIAPALGAVVRFVGSEPVDELTCHYNAVMKNLLPQRGIEVIEIPRLEQDGQPINASAVRQLLNKGQLPKAVALVPPTTLPYLVAWTACYSLEQELELTPKPGLVDTHDNGSHPDMDYIMMQRSISSLRLYFVRLATMGFNTPSLNPKDLKDIGIEAEQAMMDATGGVNTHRGALFSMGLAVVAACHVLGLGGGLDFFEHWSVTVAGMASLMPGGNSTHGASIRKLHRVTSALDLARIGYMPLLNSWLPFYCDHYNEEYAKHKTLLLIISELDDTNVIHRVGYEMAQQVKHEARQLLENFTMEGLEQMNERFIAANISPGGAADMLSLTFFLSTFFK